MSSKMIRTVAPFKDLWKSDEGGEQNEELMIWTCMPACGNRVSVPLRLIMP
jgi:hypothetical protein